MDKYLTRVVQCAKCPWKKSTNPHDIPHGYTVEAHRALACTIAKPGDPLDRAHAMSCHESYNEESVYCVGWLNHQLGPGNNIPLRIRLFDVKNLKDLRVIGPQHETFEDTLPSG